MKSIKLPTKLFDATIPRRVRVCTSPADVSFAAFRHAALLLDLETDPVWTVKALWQDNEFQSAPDPKAG